MGTNDKQIDKREDKYRRISSLIANMEVGEMKTPTDLFRTVNIHPDTGRDLMDLYDSLKSIGFEKISDKNWKLKSIKRINENLDIKIEIREMRKAIFDIKTAIEKLELKKVSKW